MPETPISIKRYLEYETSKIWDEPNWSYFQIGLSTAPITGSLAFEEVPAGSSGYSRVTVNKNSSEWTESQGGYLTNINQIEFGESLTDWGTIQCVFIVDSGTTTGSFISFYEYISPFIEAPIGTKITFEAGDIVIGRRNISQEEDFEDECSNI